MNQTNQKFPTRKRSWTGAISWAVRPCWRERRSSDLLPQDAPKLPKAWRTACLRSPADKWTDAQKKAAEEITSGPRKELVGPFIPLLRSPEYMSRLQKVGEYLRYKTKLGSNISEFIILLIARHWTQQFEWYSHESLALKAGIKAETIKAIAEGQRPAAMTPDEETIYEYVTELRLHQSVSDPVYGTSGESVRRTRRHRHHRIVRLLHVARHAHERDEDAFAAGEMRRRLATFPR